MTNKQQGWNYALKIVMEQFQYVAWRKGLDQEHNIAAKDMKKLVEPKKEKSRHYWQAIADLVRPFYERLNGELPGQTPFNT